MEKDAACCAETNAAASCDGRFEAEMHNAGAEAAPSEQPSRPSKFTDSPGINMQLVSLKVERMQLLNASVRHFALPQGFKLRAL